MRIRERPPSMTEVRCARDPLSWKAAVRAEALGTEVSARICGDAASGTVDFAHVIEPQWEWTVVAARFRPIHLRICR